MKITRRNALKGLGAAALSPLIKACGPGGEGGPPLPPATVRDRIDTVVVLMQENRSFDHYLGSLSLIERRGVEGLTDAMSNPRLDGAPLSPSPADASCIADPPHGWSASHAQWNDGSNDGFVREHERRHGPSEAHRVMGYFARDTLSAHYGLADSFALCQRWFSSVMGPTWPNRYYSLIGTSRGMRVNEPVEDEVPTTFEQVYRSGRSFGDYYGNVPFSLLSPRHSLDDPEYKRLDQFYEDAARGTLPNFVWIDPIYGRNDDHPPAHPVAGQVLIQSLYQALADSPQWERCLFVVTYDEHGGFFDHVAPPTTADDLAAQGFDQLGFRVPALVVGPYVKQGYASDTVYDHTSVFATLQAMWDLEPLTERSSAANTLFDCLDAERIEKGDPRAPVELPAIVASEAEIYAPECVSLDNPIGFSLPAAGRSITGQPELEALVARRFPGHPKNLVHETDRVYERFLDIATTQGVLKRV